MLRAFSPAAPRRSSKSSARCHCGCGRRVQPLQRARIADSHGAQVEAELGKFAPRDLRCIVFGTALEILERVEPDHAARCGAGGASGALCGGGFADASDFERRKSGPGRIARNPRHAAIDYRGHAVDGDGAFGDIGG